MDDKNKKSLTIDLNPTATPVLYCNIAGIEYDKFGVVLNFAQKIPDGKAVVVSRIGMSREHVKDFLEHIEGVLRAQEKQDF